MTARYVTVTVAAVTPSLTVAFPGDPVGVTVPAVNASGTAFAVGDRVRVQVLSPLPPQVTGRLS